jgi:GTP-binding protein
MRLPKVVIIGRPNVGKSSLFNRIIGKRQAIVDDKPGITRDRIYASSDWQNRAFALIDTGGLLPSSSDDPMTEAIREQVEFAAEEADKILFLLDWETGVTDIDLAIAKYLRRFEKPVLPVVNKADTAEREQDARDFVKLGFGEPIFISALRGRGVGDLLDVAVDFPALAEREEIEGLRIAIVGRPNVGKSSIVNALTGKKTVVVSEVPGTTRDATDTVIRFQGQAITLVDTAGLRRRGRTKEAVEFYSRIRTAGAIDRSEVVWVILDATEGLVSSDQRIIEEAYGEGKGILILMNKWDAIQKDHRTADEWEKRLRKLLGGFGHLPLIFVSAHQRKRLLKCLDLSLGVKDELTRRIATADLNNSLLPIIEFNPPPSARGKFVNIKYVTQVKAEPPTFALFCNRPGDVAEAYRRFLERTIREKYGFSGVPISLEFRRK